MRAKVTWSATGEVLAGSVRVVRIRDGRLGFSTAPVTAARLLADPRVTVTSDDGVLRGRADLVRSGTAYEEVRGRARLEEPRLLRWVGDLTRRRENVVVLDRADPSETP